jgi:hypothetical protein
MDMVREKILKIRLLDRSNPPRPPREASAIQHIIKLKVNFNDIRQVGSALAFLTYRAGDSEILQDLKSMLARRLSMEAFSRSWVTLSEVRTRKMADRLPFIRTGARFFELLRGFPAVEHLELFLEESASCQPEVTDGADIIRAKREGILFQLTKAVGNLTDQRVILTPFTKGVFMDLYGSDLEVLRAHAQHRLTPTSIAECLLKQVLDTETGLPFNIKLPD